MKFYSISLGLLIFLLCQTTSVYSAARRSAPKQNNQQSYESPNPLEEDRKLDQALFLHFVKILGNFGKILINPHDKLNVTSNASQMVDGVIAVAQELTKRGPNTLSLKDLNESQFNRIIRLIVRALVEQGIIPPVHIP